MGRLEVSVTRGASLQLYQAMWAPLYEAVLTMIGSTGLILPIGDPKHGQPNATTFKTVGEEQVTFTWSEAPNSFDTKLDLTDPDSFQGIIPVITFNGTDEEADTPDAAYWTRALGAASWGAWVRVSATASNQAILTKRVASGDKREWQFFIDTSEKLLLRLEDENDASNSYIETLADAALSTGVWHFLVATYDGSADASGINLYIDGALAASTDTDQAGFVSMRDTTSTVEFGSTAASAANFWQDKMAGGPIGPFFAQKELSADEVLRLYELGRRALAL